MALIKKYYIILLLIPAFSAAFFISRELIFAGDLVIESDYIPYFLSVEDLEKDATHAFLFKGAKCHLKSSYESATRKILDLSFEDLQTVYTYDHSLSFRPSYSKSYSSLKENDLITAKFIEYLPWIDQQLSRLIKQQLDKSRDNLPKLIHRYPQVVLIFNNQKFSYDYRLTHSENNITLNFFPKDTVGIVYEDFQSKHTGLFKPIKHISSSNSSENQQQKPNDSETKCHVDHLKQISFIKGLKDDVIQHIVGFFDQGVNIDLKHFLPFAQYAAAYAFSATICKDGQVDDDHILKEINKHCLITLSGKNNETGEALQSVEILDSNDTMASESFSEGDSSLLYDELIEFKDNYASRVIKTIKEIRTQKSVDYSPLLALPSISLMNENNYEHRVEINKLLAFLRKSNLPTDEKIKILSYLYVGTPTVKYCLGEGKDGDIDQKPLFRIDVTDCTALILQVVSFLNADLYSKAVEVLKSANYYDSGGITYDNRFHFTTERISHSPYFTNITSTIFDDSSYYKTFTVKLNQNLFTGNLFLPKLSRSFDQKEITYIPLSSIDMAIEKLNNNAVGVAFVKESFSQAGLDVTHEGILLDKYYLVHAARDKSVVRWRFKGYIFNEKNNYDGIIFYTINELPINKSIEKNK